MSLYREKLLKFVLLVCLTLKSLPVLSQVDRWRETLQNSKNAEEFLDVVTSTANPSDNYRYRLRNFIRDNADAVLNLNPSFEQLNNMGLYIRQPSSNIALLESGLKRAKNADTIQ